MLLMFVSFLISLRKLQRTKEAPNIAVTFKGF
ncbi:hypothetical protein VPH234P9_0039 [Vibrio phage 234P9]